jgi:phosphatidate phosphatase APP1
MKLRSSIERLVARADRMHAIARRRWQQLSPFDRRWTIVPYLGFGTRERLHCGGRVLRHVEHRPSDASHGGWQNFAEFWKRMDSDEVPGARVRACFGSRVIETLADDEGHFEFDLRLQPPIEADGWQQVELELLSPPPRRGQSVKAKAQVLVPPASARFGVISDLDDTVVWSNVRSKLRMLAMLARSNPRTRKPFKGVAAFYRALHQGAGGHEGNPFFYVSSSPWNLHAPLLEFLSLQGLPSGPLMLKDFGDHMLFGSGDHRTHKLQCIERVFSTYPGLPFLLIGDSGEQDPEIYRHVLDVHPGRVRAVYIRTVDPTPARLAAIDRLVTEAQSLGVPLVLAPDSESAAVHAATAGLIAPDALAEVRADKRAEGAAAPV